MILWADTFNNHFFPETAQAAVDVRPMLDATCMSPCSICVAGVRCIDYGFLDLAKSHLQKCRIRSATISRRVRQ